MDYVLKTYDLTKHFKGKKVVNHVDLKVGRGDIYGLIGRNGAGKSTFMKMVCGMLLPTEGRIELFGTNKLDEGRKRIGCLIENPAFYPTMTARENMIYYSTVTGNGTSQIDKILEFTGLADTGDKKTRLFSLGMKQRLSIAIALIGDADFMILDEPTNGLDPMGIREIRELLTKLNTERNITILISSHILGELSKIASRYGVIEEGCLVDEFSADELTQRCRKFIRLEVNDTQRAEDILRNKYGCMEYQVVDENRINIFEGLEKMGEINKFLMMNDINVKSIAQDGQDLEEYFVNIMRKQL